MKSIEKCDVCLRNQTLLSGGLTEYLQRYGGLQTETVCINCGKGYYNKAQGEVQTIFKKSDALVSKYGRFVPVISSDAHRAWDYQVLQMVSARYSTNSIKSAASAVAGYMIVDAAAGFGRGELYCMKKLRLNALSVGGNAVIAVDIDLDTLGQVTTTSMNGTAIAINNPETISSGLARMMNNGAEILKELQFLRNFTPLVTMPYIEASKKYIR